MKSNVGDEEPQEHTFMLEVTTRMRNSENYQDFMRKKKNKVFLYFCLGFILSTIISFTIFFLANANEHLLNSNNETSTTSHVVPFDGFTSTVVSTVYSSPEKSNEKSPLVEKCEKRVIGYHSLESTRTITKNQLSKLTHLILFPILVNYNGTLSFTENSEELKFESTIREARRYPNLKVMISNYDGGFNKETLSKLLAESNLKLTLLNSISSFVKEHSLDGIDFTLRFPATESEFAILNLFFEDLRNAFSGSILASPEKRFVISSIVSAYLSPNFDVDWKHVDFLTVETDNFYGPWHSDGHLVGPASPLYSELAEKPTENIDKSMKDYSCLTKQPNKFNIFVDFFGLYWKNVINPVNQSETLWMKAERMNETISGLGLSRKDMQKNGWNLSDASWNDDSKTPYIWNADKQEYLTFENERSLREKVNYAIENNIGGLAVWHIEEDDDDDDAALLDVLSSANLCSGNDNTAVKYDCN